MDRKMWNRRRGLVLLYAVTVFSVIAAIGITLLDSGEAFLNSANTDVHLLVAQQAALSGLAYGEAMIQAMLNQKDNSAYDHAGPVPYVSMPSWAGRRPSGNLYLYQPLYGARPTLPSGISDPAFGSVVANTSAVTYTFQQSANERYVFRIELRDCSIPNPGTAGCLANLFDENLMRNGLFFQGGVSPYKGSPNSQQFQFALPPPQNIPTDSSFLYTLRVEGEAQFNHPTLGWRQMAFVVAKEPFKFDAHNILPQAFWYQDIQRGY